MWIYACKTRARSSFFQGCVTPGWPIDFNQWDFVCATYTWTLPIGTSSAPTDRFVLQAEGYNPLTALFSPCSDPVLGLGGGPDGNGRLRA